MQNLDTITHVAGRTVDYPIKLVGKQYKNIEDTMEASTLWRLQQAIFHAKLDALQFALREGYVPVSGSELEITVNVRQRVVDAEATDGKWIDVPANLNHLVTYKLDKPVWQT